MNHYLDFEEDNDTFRWGGSLEDLKKLIDEVLSVSEQDVAEAEVKEDKTHKAVTYKVKNCSIRLYTTNGTLMVHGADQSILKEKLHNICDKNKNPNNALMGSTDAIVEVIDEAPNAYSSNLASMSLCTTTNDQIKDQDEVILLSEGTILEENTLGSVQTNSDLTFVFEEITQLKEEIKHIKECYLAGTNAPSDVVVEQPPILELQQCRQEIKILKTRLKNQEVFINRLEEEKASLITAMKLMSQDTENLNHNVNEKSLASGSDKRKSQETLKETKEKKKHKKKPNRKNNDDQNSPTTSSGEAADQSKEQKNERKTTVIIGDSIISKLSGWKMSDKANRITIRAFPGSKIEDMKDYIKPTLRSPPDNLILHIGSNNLRSDDSRSVAEEIVKTCEEIQHTSPGTKIAISELTTRQDSNELEQKRIDVNKILRSFAKTRDWKVIAHNNIDPSCLNKRKLHMNVRGTINLAKNFKNYLTNQH